MRHHTHDLLSPVPGTGRQIHSFHYGPQNGAGKVYIQASLHADELPGMLVAWYLSSVWPSWKMPVACWAKSLWCPSPTRSVWNRC